MLMGWFEEIIIKDLGQHFVFKLVHGFCLFNLDKNIEGEDFKVLIKRPYATTAF